MTSILYKVFLDAVLDTPVYYTLYFSYMGAIEGKGPQQWTRVGFELMYWYNFYKKYYVF